MVMGLSDRKRFGTWDIRRWSRTSRLAGIGVHIGVVVLVDL